MLIKNDVRCAFCPKTFCCVSCRELHEQAKHVSDINANKVDCFLCVGKLQPLNSDILGPEVEHIIEEHLPLYCKKCNKVFISKEDFKDIKSCVLEKMEPQIPGIEIDKENVSPSTSVDQNDIEKLLAEGNISEEMLTPLSKINLKWRRKSAGLQGSITDNSGSSSFASLKKISSPNAKMRRTTSTPMMPSYHLKPGATDSLCGSSYQASSIDGLHEASTSSSIGPSPAHQVPLRHVARSSRKRIHISQTPLRQVMSKSIQKALQQHGPRMLQAQRKIAFSSMSSSSSSSGSFENTEGALDLRTTPVLKRCHSSPVRSEIPPKTFVVAEESVVVQTEVSHSTELENKMNEERVEEEEVRIEYSSTTAFLSCHTMGISTLATPEKRAARLSEVWFTPVAFEDKTRVFQENDDSDVENRDVTESLLRAPKRKSPESKFPGIIRKFLGIGDFSDTQPRGSFLQRATGWILKKKPEPEPQKGGVKRPRVSSLTSPLASELRSPIAKKYKAIQGRRPIRRMRTT